MMNQGFEILDFHTHPFNQDKFNVCSYFKNYEMGEADMKKTLEVKTSGKELSLKLEMPLFATYLVTLEK